MQHSKRNSWHSAFSTALDSTAMASYLASRLPGYGQPGAGLVVTGLELLDHKPGRRGLIRYEVAALDGSRRDVVFAKLYADRGQLSRVDKVLHALYDALLPAGMPGSVPEPLCTIPALAMLVYKPAEGRFLDEEIARGSGAEAVALTAAWLGALHHHPLDLAKQLDLAGELRNLGEWAAIVAATYPELAPLARQALDYLRQQAPALPLTAWTPIHKDFHYRHVLLGRGVKVIDFDEVRLGDPNFDLAHFCANLELLAYRQYRAPEGLRSLERRFLDVYAGTTGWSWDTHCGRFVWFYVYTCLKLARQLSLGFGPGPVPAADERRREAAVMMQQAARALAGSPTAAPAVAVPEIVTAIVTAVAALGVGSRKETL